ncbi:MAG: tetratricopeptide repeat-containing sensor histidine kinase [Candidatus Margulisbacteria bacterium]|nr:tetratricopeptide repeat-containing sensor histidine kinase [Candidatus Margulisiibacteriota bacterium]
MTNSLQQSDFANDILLDMFNLVNGRKILYEGQQLIAEGNHRKAIKVITAALEKVNLGQKYSKETNTLIFNLYRLLYEATSSIENKEQCKLILDKLYIWSVKCHEELWGRLESLEFSVRYQELDNKNCSVLLSDYYQLMQKAASQGNNEVFVWAGNKYLKLAANLDVLPPYEELATKCLKYAHELHLTEAELWLLFHLGLIHLKEEKYELAEDCFIKALDLAYEINQKEGIKWTSFNLGKIYLHKPDTKDKATRYFAQAINIYYQTDSPQNQQNILKGYMPELFNTLVVSNRLSIINKGAISDIHELKNILAAQNLATSNLFDQLKELKIEDQLISRFKNSILNSQQTATKIVKNILNFASGNPDLNTNKILNVSNFLHGFVSLAQPIVKKAQANLLLNIQPKTENIEIETNELVLTQALLNLILNSIEAMKGEGKVEISLTNQDPHHCIVVSDTGAGIKKEILPRLFQPFNTSKQQGTGIGLYTTKELLNQNKMDIALLETGPTGTKFGIVLVE